MLKIYWWPSVVSDIYKYICCYHGFQKAVNVPNYRTAIGFCLTLVFHRLSINFGQPLLVDATVEIFSSRCSWKTIRVANSAHFQIWHIGRFLEFFKEEIDFCFGLLNTTKSDNGRSFTVSWIQRFMKYNNILGTYLLNKRQCKMGALNEWYGLFRTRERKQYSRKSRFGQQL